MKTLFTFSGRVPAGRAFAGTRYHGSPEAAGRTDRKVIPHAVAASIAACLFAPNLHSQEAIDSSRTKPVVLSEVMVSATRATTKTPVAFSNLSKTEIEKRNLGQDIPVLLNFLPSVVTTSDAGNGFGYTGIRVRGSDATRVNVTINGIPYNDSESSGTYFVDLPDFASSLESIQLQRGVGTSTNGAGAFGASLNLLTDKVSDSANAEIANSFGSFNSRKHTVKFSTGLMNDHFEVSGRLAVLHSDGYVDRAESDLKSYFLQGTYVGKTSTIKALVFGGHERTYLAWNGVDAATLERDPTFNYSGMYTDEFGNTRFYKNEVDDYGQGHYQLHWNEKLSDRWSTNLAFHYTIGKGYYENYKEDETLADYGMTNVTVGGETITESDLVRRKWLDNDFYGTTFSANYKSGKVDFVAGGALNNYEGKHFGEVVWSRFASASEPMDHYYDQNAIKTDFNIFTKATYGLTEKWSLFGDLQYRTVDYNTTLDGGIKVDENYGFFNPKAGVTYSIDKRNSLYLSYAKANKEPSRTDFENGSPRPESLDDYELGWRFASEKMKLNANVYYMDYKDQLVKTGELDDVGNELHANVAESYRAGVEVDANIAVAKNFSVMPNIALSTNKIKDYTIVNASGVQMLGTTNISFSPEIVGALAVAYDNKSFHAALLTKYVGEQFAGNIDSDVTKLDSYSTTDLSLSYELKTKSLLKSIVFTGLVNNVFDKEYVSNAYLYGEDYVSYFPQAGINFLAGAALKF